MDRSLVEFYRKFKQQIDPPGIPSGTVLKHPDVQRALENRFFNIKAESLSAYQARILRVVIERTQNAITDPEEEEVSDHLMTLLATLPRSRPELDLSKTLVTYFPPVGYDNEYISPIQVLEAKKIIGSGPNTGLRTWEASLRLAHYLHSNPKFVRNRSVVELGAGTGFLSIFCATYLSPKRVLATDGHEDVLVSLRENIELNDDCYKAVITQKPTVQRLFWGDLNDINEIHSAITNNHVLKDVPSSVDNSSSITGTSQFDTVLGADITYSPSACISLAQTLSILTQRNPDTTILISATQRNLETMEIFLQACRDPAFRHQPDKEQEHGSDAAISNNSTQQGEDHTLALHVEEVSDFQQLPKFDGQTGCFHNVLSPIRLWRIRAAPASAEGATT